ncbi:uncharacterized protein LOC119577164 [Penaeus monodon]|uniref:uncharacterized protein LOC119577164 n=1 Tax=Penaeus monodon TaxID=6687 RepID=UPI0018A70F40|nr:uncharacterized protein LOC119577164 [Penaeus monodon]XP_037780805.1 uncharacterized protein LOC119577164 [Penaeus monodon]
MAKKGNLSISVVATLLLMSTWRLCESSACPCSDRQVQFQKEYQNFKVDDVFAFMRSHLHCCTFALLGYEDRNATITWEFNGEPHPWPKTVSNFEWQFCGPETIETREVALTDAGNYTCTVTSFERDCCQINDEIECFS